MRRALVVAGAPVAGVIVAGAPVAGVIVAGALVAGVIVAGALVAGCAPQTRQVEVKRAVGANVAREPRLGWVSWSDAETLVACNRRIDDDGRPIGVLGPCRQARPDGSWRSIVSFTNTDPADSTPADAGPGPACSLELEDTRSPDTQPARLWLRSPSGRTLLEAWSPERTLTADQYRLEASYSPDGARLAIVRLAIGLGEGERTIEATSVRLLARPACP